MTAAAQRRVDRPTRVLKVLIALVAALILAVGGVVGWAQVKFNALPKIATGSELGVAPDYSATIDYPDVATPAQSDASTGTTPELVLEPQVSASIPGSPATAPTIPIPGASTTVASLPAPTTTLPKPAPAANEPLPDEVALAALAEAGAEDEIEVQAGPTTKPRTTKEPVVYDTIPPGQIVPDLLSVEPFGGPSTRNYLMIGVDSRENLEGQEVGFGVGKVTGSRTDTIIVLRIDEAARRAWLLSIPRDLWVPVAGTGRYGRINSAFNAKGAGNLVKTIRDRLGLPIDSVVRVDFAGFQRIVGTIGGVELCLKYPARDRKSGLNRPNAGCQNFDARGATAYVRSRYYQQLVDGVWKQDPRGDLGRIVRQQEFIRAVMAKARNEATNPLTLNAMTTDMQQAIAIDTGISLGDAARLANDLRSFDPATLEAYTIPTTGARIDGKAVLLVNRSKAKPILGKFRG